jgi:antitoxin (DNA-binding transcriptional repressor) of toxin-antitoxin stability system
MGVVKVDEIKDQVEDLLTRVEAGETILIERDGKTVARISPAEIEASEKKAADKIDIGPLREFTRSQTMQQEDSGDFIRKMRDEARY